MMDKPSDGLQLRAKELRKEMTPQERKLWYCYIRKSSLHWYKQRILTNRYIADFYCPKIKLVIEIDGRQHYTKKGMEYDEVRTEVMNMHHIDVIRITNQEIDGNFNNVCQRIDKIILEKMHQFNINEK